MATKDFSLCSTLHQITVWAHNIQLSFSFFKKIILFLSPAFLLPFPQQEAGKGCGASGFKMTAGGWDSIELFAGFYFGLLGMNQNEISSQ